MNRASFCSFGDCVKICILLVCSPLWVKALPGRETTRCIFTTVEGVQTFEFVCEPYRPRKEYFTNGSPIFCESESGHHFYKERRHQITFQNCRLQQLPVIFKWYRSVRLLNVSSMGLESLENKDFNGAGNLVTLIASHNQIEEIPYGLFEDAGRISVVDLSFNKISRINPLAFNVGNNITLLDLSHNLIADIDNRTFAKLSRQLDTLDLGYNVMEAIPDGLFDGLSSLRSLYLGNNRLKQLGCPLFDHLTSLKTLHLTDNKLQSFDSNCIQSNESFSLFLSGNELTTFVLSGNVTEINVSANKITKITIADDFAGSEMIAFNSSKNRIENIVDVLKQFGSPLEILDVSDSPVGSLSVDTFEPFYNLEYLVLRNTSLSNIQFGTFHFQQQLTVMDLSDNNLKRINFEMLHWNSKNLERLYLDGNGLADLSNLTRILYPSLKYVSIDDNNFDCEYLSAIRILWKINGISVVSNQIGRPAPQNTSGAHIDGMACTDQIVVKLLPKDGKSNDKEESLSVSIETEAAAAVAAAAAAGRGGVDSISMWKIEFLLICIIVMLVCLMLMTIVKNFFPNFRRNMSSGVIRSCTEERIEEQSLL